MLFRINSLVAMSVFMIVCDIEDASYKFLNILMFKLFPQERVEDCLNIGNEFQLNDFPFKECQWLDVFSHNPQPGLLACLYLHHLGKKKATQALEMK